MGTIKGWKYYNHAAIPDCAPHEDVDISPILNGNIWSMDGSPLFARWTEEFDCGYETSWWYVVKFSPFDISELSSKRRKNIKQALKKCNVRIVNPEDYIEQLYTVYKAAYTRYENADNLQTFNQFCDMCRKDKSDGIDYWAGFSVDENMLIGFMTVEKKPEYVESRVAKYHPDYLSYRVSDAIHFSVLEEYLNHQGKRYITAGSRNINHITNAQDYKIENFNFRRAYCLLHLRYKPFFGAVIKLVYPLRSIIKKVNCTLFHQLYSVLYMEELARSSRNNVGGNADEKKKI